MTKVIARVHTVHDECRPKATNPQTKPSDIGCESAENWLLPSTSTIAIVYYYLARKLIIILPSHAGWKAKRTAAHAQGCISQWLSWLTQPSAVWFEPGSSHTAVRRANHSANVLNFKPRLYFSHFCKKKLWHYGEPINGSIIYSKWLNFGVACIWCWAKNGSYPRT